MPQFKRQAYLFIPIILVIALAVSISLLSLQLNTATSTKKTTAPQNVNTSYDASVEVHVQNKTTSGTLHVSTINDTQKLQNAVYFHLYPNTFRDESKLIGPDWASALGKNHKPGWIDIANVKVNGKETPFTVTDTILEIPLKEWAIGQTVAIDMDFTIQIPMNDLRLSYDDAAIWFGNWLPIRAVFDANGWNLDPYYAIGDPFYSDVANYKVKITVPEDYKVASTGVDEKEPSVVNGGKRTYTVSVDQARDFSMTVMGPLYDSITSQAGDITVRTWHRKTDDKDRVQFLHNVAVQSIAYFGEKYGAYPYKEYDVIRTGGYFGGMEYPGLVYIQNSYFNSPNPFGAVAVAHETAHQWWYFMVGNNEVKEPWLDESLTNYSTLRFLLDQVPSVGDYELKRRQQGFPNTAKYEQQHDRVGGAVTEFKQNASYASLVYTKGPEMFYRLEQAAGVDKMNEALRQYLGKYQYKNATGTDFIDTFAGVYGPNVKDYFNAWLNGSMAEYKK